MFEFTKGNKISPFDTSIENNLSEISNIRLRVADFSPESLYEQILSNERYEIRNPKYLPKYEKFRNLALGDAKGQTKMTLLIIEVF